MTRIGFICLFIISISLFDRSFEFFARRRCADQGLTLETGLALPRPSNRDKTVDPPLANGPVFGRIPHTAAVLILALPELFPRETLFP